jgi:predicted nucleic acid-binding protein
MSVFFDTNVLVYAVDRSVPARRSVAIELLGRHVREHRLVVSTQVLQEFYAVATRRGLLAPADALEMVSGLAREPVVPSSGEFVVRALALAQRHRLSSWDALIVQAALDARCRVLLSEDLSAGTRFGELEVVNPFAPGVHDAPAAGGVSAGAKTASPSSPTRTRGRKRPE